MQLSEILLAVKSNNPKKLPKDDEEELESRQKMLKTILSGLFRFLFSLCSKQNYSWKVADLSDFLNFFVSQIYIFIFGDFRIV